MALHFTYPGQRIAHPDLPLKLISMTSDISNSMPCRYITYNTGAIDVNDINLNSVELYPLDTMMYNICSANKGDKVTHKTHTGIVFEVRSVNMKENTMECDLITGPNGGLYTFGRFEMKEYPKNGYPADLTDPLE